MRERRRCGLFGFDEEIAIGVLRWATKCWTVWWEGFVFFLLAVMVCVVGIQILRISRCFAPQFLHYRESPRLPISRREPDTARWFWNLEDRNIPRRWDCSMMNSTRLLLCHRMPQLSSSRTVGILSACTTMSINLSMWMRCVSSHRLQVPVNSRELTETALRCDQSFGGGKGLSCPRNDRNRVDSCQEALLESAATLSPSRGHCGTTLTSLPSVFT